jgi:hypothetical protein
VVSADFGISITSAALTLDGIKNYDAMAVPNKNIIFAKLLL